MARVGLRVLLGCCLGLGACAAPEAPPEADLVRDYFTANNAAARHGSAAQHDFFARTQHPDYRDQVCDLNGMTVTVDPAWSTLRPSPGFSPDGADPARGQLWVIAAEVISRRDGEVAGRQMGSLHLAILDGHVHGFAPCPS